MQDGRKVTTAQMWWQERRPELVELFDREVYGRVPKETPQVNWEVASTKEDKNGDIPVITKQLVGHVDNSAYPPIKVDIQLTLTTPAEAKGPVPVMMDWLQLRGICGQKGWQAGQRAARKGIARLRRAWRLWRRRPNVAAAGLIQGMGLCHPRP